MLEQIGDSGLYVMSEPVCPFPPQEVLPTGLGLRQIFIGQPDEAVDELVRRLLEFSLEQNSWVGVDWTVLMSKLEQEKAVYQEMVEKSQPATQAYLQARKEYLLRNNWTFGLYGYFRPVPLEPKNPELEAFGKKVMWSGGERREKLGMAVMTLKEQDYLKVEIAWLAGDGTTNVLFPTPSLVWKYVSGEKA